MGTKPKPARVNATSAERASAPGRANTSALAGPQSPDWFGALESASDLMFVHDAAGQLLWANSSALRFWGHTREEVQSTNILELAASGQAEQLRACWTKSLRGERLPPIIVEFEIGKGTRRSLEVSTCGVPQGVPPGAMLSIARDVSDRVLAEQALCDSEARF